jgi:hypothetical protein
MKTIKNQKFLKVLSAFRVQLKSKMNAMASVKAGRALIRYITSMLPVIGLHTTSSRIRAIVVFTRHISNLYRHNGAKGACLILKVYTVVLQQSLGGHIVYDLTELKFRISRTNLGLPRVIPRIHRAEIRRGDFKLAKFYLTLFNLYRVIEFKGDYRFASLVKTIVTPAKVGVGFIQLQAELLAYIPMFYWAMMPLTGLSAKSLNRELLTSYRDATAFPLLKSSPFTLGQHKFEGLTRAEQAEAMAKLPAVSTHPTAIMAAALALLRNKELVTNFHFFLDLLKDNSPMKNAISQISGNIPAIGGEFIPNPQYSPPLGKLSLKAESAGKVRVFAMVDPWTQWLLKPLHQVIFDHILSAIPQDGTLNQLKPLRELLKRDPATLFSLDLSAATDRLPLWLEKAVLAGFTGKEFSENWASFLVNRDYSLTLTNVKEDKPRRYRVRYAVGQPMGAYSSWAMLALVHHFIVQYCAKKSGVTNGLTWFTDYCIVGDDIVIGNARVAKEYLRVMRVLGVGIGLHKSLISASGSAVEFAKRTFWKGVDVSPVPFTELAAAFNAPSAAVEFIKKYNLSLAAFVKAAGYKFKVLGSLQKPLGKLNAKIRLIILAINIPYTPDEIEKFFSIGAPRSFRSQFETRAVIDALVGTEFRRMKVGLNKIRAELGHLEGMHLRAKDIAEEWLGMWGEEVLLTPEMAEDLAWAREEANADPDKVDTGEAFGFEYSASNAAVLRTVERLAHAQRLGRLIPLVKILMELTVYHPKMIAQTSVEQISGQLVQVMLYRFDYTPVELYTSLIGLSKAIANLPMASINYVRLVDDSIKTFTDGMHIRLWKSLSGIVQGTKKVLAPRPEGAFGFPERKPTPPKGSGGLQNSLWF